MDFRIFVRMPRLWVICLLFFLGFLVGAAASTPPFNITYVSADGYLNSTCGEFSDFPCRTIALGIQNSVADGLVLVLPGV
jgi:hypothetical protein